MDVKGKRILVVGLARSGFAAAQALARRGATVTVLDRKPPAELVGLFPQLLKDKIGLELGSQQEETFLRHDVIVLSPGVPWDLPQLSVARERQIPVFPEVEAASWYLQGTLVGVTGSNGKTTTTALLGDMLKASGFPTFVGGNIGNALSLAVDHTPVGTKFVTELSSFQLEGIQKFRPHVAVMLNLSPNHLDRHPSVEAYAHAKRQIFRNQDKTDYAVLNADDPWVAGLQAEVPSQPVFFSRQAELPSGVFVSAGKVYYRLRNLERMLFETRDMTLRGEFNLENVLAAATAACVLGADFAAVRKAVREFRAVEHRLEFVREIKGVDFYNNSKATSVDATLKSLEAFEQGVHLIMGGKDKGAPYAPLAPFIKERVREILLIGAAAPVIAEQLAGSAELVPAGDLATAVYEAFIRARPGDTVLLAPACSSFDQFKDYEERGRWFKALVNKLAEDVAMGTLSRSSLLAVGRSELPPAEDYAGAPSSGQALASAEAPVQVLPASLSPPVPAVQTEQQAPAKSDRAGHVADLTLVPILEVLESAPKGVPEERSAPQGAEEITHPRLEFADEGQGTPQITVTSSPVADANAVQNSPLEMKVEEAVTPALASPAPDPMVTHLVTPQHRQLTYVYEVDAIDMPATDTQAERYSEPEVAISSSSLEDLDDEALPFEVRKAAMGAVAQNEDFNAPPTPQQGRLPGVD